MAGDAGTRCGEGVERAWSSPRVRMMSDDDSRALVHCPVHVHTRRRPHDLTRLPLHAGLITPVSTAAVSRHNKM